MGWFRTKESYLPQLALVLLGLAISVFTWGLQYKLSLYDPPQAISHQMPEAKLLSKEEQMSKAESPLLGASEMITKKMELILPSIFLLIALALKLRRALKPSGSVHDLRTPFRPRLLACLDAFFFRPPPRS